MYTEITRLHLCVILRLQDYTYEIKNLSLRVHCSTFMRLQITRLYPRLCVSVH